MKLRKPLHQRLHGFTLMEIMLVVTIIALLAGLAIFKMGGVVDVGNEAAAKATLNSYRTSLIAYKARAGVYPSTAQGLQALVDKPGGEPVPMSWKRIVDRLDKDPWGRDYVYKCPGEKNRSSYDLYSKGDNLDSTDDDIWAN